MTSPLPEHTLFTASISGLRTARTSLSTSPAWRTSLLRGRRIGLRASVGQTQGSPCVKAPGSWRIAAAELSRCLVVLPSACLAQKLTPYPLPTKDGGVRRTVGDAHAY